MTCNYGKNPERPSFYRASGKKRWRGVRVKVGNPRYGGSWPHRRYFRDRGSRCPTCAGLCLGSTHRRSRRRPFGTRPWPGVQGGHPHARAATEGGGARERCACATSGVEAGRAGGAGNGTGAVDADSGPPSSPASSVAGLSTPGGTERPQTRGEGLGGRPSLKRPLGMSVGVMCRMLLRTSKSLGRNDSLMRWTDRPPSRAGAPKTRARVRAAGLETPGPARSPCPNNHVVTPGPWGAPAGVEDGRAREGPASFRDAAGAGA